MLCYNCNQKNVNYGMRIYYGKAITSTDHKYEFGGDEEVFICDDCTRLLKGKLKQDLARQGRNGAIGCFLFALLVGGGIIAIVASRSAPESVPLWLLILIGIAGLFSFLGFVVFRTDDDEIGTILVALRKEALKQKGFDTFWSNKRFNDLSDQQRKKIRFPSEDRRDMSHILWPDTDRSTPR